MYFRDCNIYCATHTEKSVPFPYITTLTLPGDPQQLFLVGITLFCPHCLPLAHSPCLALSLPLSLCHFLSPLHSSTPTPSLLSLPPAVSPPSFTCTFSLLPSPAPTGLLTHALALSCLCPCFLAPLLSPPTPTLIRHSLMPALIFESC